MIVGRRVITMMFALVACGPRGEGSSDSGGASGSGVTGGASDSEGSSGTGETTASPGCTWPLPETSGGSSEGSSSSGEPSYLDLGVPPFDAQAAAGRICDAVLDCDCAAPPFADRDACVAAMLAEFELAAQAAADNGLVFDEGCVAKLAVTFPTLDCAAPTLADRREHLCPVVTGAKSFAQACTEYPGGSDCDRHYVCSDGSCRDRKIAEGVDCEHPGQTSGCPAGMYCSDFTVCAPLPRSGEECASW